MIKYIFSKSFQYILLIFLVLSLNFLLPRLMPGSPLMYLAGEDVGLMNASEKEVILEKYGLNDSLLSQYGQYIKNTLKGDLGFSFQQKKETLHIILEKLPWTLLLAGLNLLLSTLLGIFCGVVAAWKRGTKMDISLLTFFMFLSAMPSFWLGMIFVSIFSAQLGWFPVFGAEEAWANYLGWDRFFDILHHLVLPLITLILLSATTMFMTMRYSMLDVLAEDYIMMAKAKGVKEKVIKYRHAMKNALLPVSTIFMLNLGFMFSGATIIETVFAYPGIGRLMYESVLNRDYPLIQSTFLIMTFSVILANMLADIIYPILDPKVRRSYG